MASLLAGCAAREPLARTTVTVELDKQTYRTLVERAGTSSTDVGVGAGGSFGSDGSRSVGMGLSLSFQITTDVRLVGLDADNLERRSFEESLHWGSNTVELPLHHRRVMVLLVGSGYDGRIRRQVGELDITQLAPGGYTLAITDADAVLSLKPR